MHTIRLVLPFFIFLFLFLTPAFATVINIDPTQETYVSQRYSTTNYSTICSYDIKTGPSNEWTFAYFKFNLSAIPANATINNAYISNWQSYARTGTNRNVEAWNTTQNWTMYNITWNAKHDVSVLQSNTSGVNYSQGSITVGRKNFTVTNAVSAAYDAGTGTVSLALRDSVNASATLYWADFNKHLCFGDNYEFLVVNYSLKDCSADCGACGCNEAGDDCYKPPIVGSYCDYSAVTRGGVRTTDASCGTSYFDCPEGTYCNVISPQANVTTLLPDTTDCSKCWFINYKDIWGVWHVFLSNCFPLSDAYINQCDCNSQFCSPHIYSTNLTDVNFSVNVWTAGCFNPSTGAWTNITDESGSPSSFDNITDKFCPNCVIDYNRTSCPNTTTLCYDSSCNQVQCSKIVSSSTCSANYGGQIALQIGGLMGITDCSMSMWVLSMLLSLATGFGVLYYGRDKKIGINGFVVGTLGMLIMFTLVGWFPTWVMIIFIVISAYLMAKGIGLGGG